MADLKNMMANNQQTKIANTFDTARLNIENKLFPLWEELYGNDKNIINERCDTVEGAVSNLIADMIREEEENKAEYLMKYEALLAEATTLECELSIVVTRRGEGTEPLCVKIHNLELDLEAHRRVKAERLAQLKTLQDEEKTLCAKLEQTNQYALVTTVPSEATLNEIRDYVKSLHKELKARQAKYQALRTEVLGLWNSLEIVPEGVFEQKIQTNELVDKLGTDNLEQLAALKAKLEGRREAMATEMDTLKYTLSTLWNRLDTNAAERESFIIKHAKLCTSSLAAYKKEIEVQTALKLKHIHKIVGAIREELEDWWNRAHIGESEREKFAEFYVDDDITEEVLEKHEAEVESVKQYYEENRDILDLLEKRFELWREMVDLEDKANDKERLFKNRGGQLLIEEKKRKFIQKELPKLEKTLDKLFDRYEAANNGAVFLYDGEEARALLAAQWEDRNMAKENVKNARKNVVSSAASQSSGPKSRTILAASNVTARHTPARSGTLKRKGEPTPTQEPPKRGRLLESATRNNTARLAVTGSAKKPQVGGSSPASSVLSYSLFQNQLDVGTALNSTYDSHRSQDPKPEPQVAPTVRSTPKPGSKLRVPARSKLLSPKVRTKPATSTKTAGYRSGPTAGLTPRVNGTQGLTPRSKCTTPRTGLTPCNGTLTRSRSQIALTPRANATLTRSRTQTQLTPRTPHNKLPFIF